MDWREKARLRPRELAEAASVSLATIKRRIASEEIQSYVEGRMRFVPIREVFRVVGEEGPEDLASPTPRVSPEAEKFVRQLRGETS